MDKPRGGRWYMDWIVQSFVPEGPKRGGEDKVDP